MTKRLCMPLFVVCINLELHKFTYNYFYSGLHASKYTSVNFSAIQCMGLDDNVMPNLVLQVQEK